MPSSTETPNSGGASSSSSSPTYSSASVSDRSPGPQRGSSGKKPLVKAKSEVTSSLLKFSLDLIKSDSPTSATSTQSVKGAALPRDKPLLKLEKLPPSETGDQEAGRGRRSSTSESADAITPRRTALKKKVGSLPNSAPPPSILSFIL
jgi:hypothetical protein